MRQRPSRLVLLGHPVEHSRSPAMHAAALARAGIDLGYAALDVAPDDFDRLLDALIADGAAGNVTIPFKERAAARCDWLSTAAQRAGAVNTFWSVEGELHGDNTDIGGFQAAALELLGAVPAGARIALLGAGGAAAAVLAAVERWPGCAVAVHARTGERATRLASRFQHVARAVPTRREALDGATIVVNATPLDGEDGPNAPAPLDELPAASAVIDLVYRPRETAWVLAARARGHRAVGGLPMLVEQGALAWRRWLGVEPDRAVMRAALQSPAVRHGE